MSWTLMLGCCLAVLSLAGCAWKDGESPRDGFLSLRDWHPAQAPECDGGPPGCPEGLSCSTFKLEGVRYTRCVDPVALCQEIFTCPAGAECLVQESNPVQIVCQGYCTGSDCDASVSISNPD